MTIRIENESGTFEGYYDQPCKIGDTITIEVDGERVTGILVFIY